MNWNESWRNWTFRDVIYKLVDNSPYSRWSTLSYWPAKPTRKLIPNWRFFILHGRYICATIWPRGDGEGYALISIRSLSAHRITDRNAVVERDEKCVWVSAKVISEHEQMR